MRFAWRASFGFPKTAVIERQASFFSVPLALAGQSGGEASEHDAWNVLICCNRGAGSTTSATAF
jgi:hypothetical protein